VEGEQLRMLDYRMPPSGAGVAAQAPVATVFPPERFPLWSSLARREPVVIDDLYGETPQAVSYRAALGERMAAVHGPVRAYLAVPMVLQERVIGALALSHVDVAYFTARHVAVAQAIANQAAIAIENARLYGRAQEAAALEERQRLARELHDSVSQALYGIALGARTAHALLERDPAQVGEPLEYVVALAEAGLAEMRALILELLPEAIATDGLVAALEKQIAALRARHRIAVTATLGSEPEVPLETKEALYRIAQEALHNVVKHARARSVEVQLACGPEGLLLDVSDDGVGFDTGAAFPGHLGLRTMRERATGVGGTLEIASAPGGTRIRVHVPR
jgi:signal transduction histidine kinase